jgi:glyoxylase-like metal-dependent hydrolase (beta-lactamase superfamily II)
MQQPSPTQSQRADIPLPEAREVVPGIWKITLPIPFPLKMVNVYALVGQDGWTLVDAGMGTPEARTAFTAGLAKAGLDLSQLRSIVLTHHHPDHVGLSGELQEQSKVPVYMHEIDERSLRSLREGDMHKRFISVSQFFRQHGLENTQLWYNQTPPDQVRRILRVPPHEAFVLVEDGSTIELSGEQYRVLWVPGHSDGQIVLFRERDGVFLAADHVLPRITPNIGLYSDRDRTDPLDDYLHSLQKVEHLPANHVLPGHGEPFTDLGGRAREIIQHHNERLADILTILKERPQNAAEITKQLFPSRRIQNHEALRMAIAEILAHLEYLRLQGKLRQQLTDDEVILYEIV